MDYLCEKRDTILSLFCGLFSPQLCLSPPVHVVSVHSVSAIGRPLKCHRKAPEVLKAFTFLFIYYFLKGSPWRQESEPGSQEDRSKLILVWVFPFFISVRSMVKETRYLCFSGCLVASLDIAITSILFSEKK